GAPHATAVDDPSRVARHPPLGPDLHQWDLGVHLLDLDAGGCGPRQAPEVEVEGQLDVMRVHAGNSWAQRVRAPAVGGAWGPRCHARRGHAAATTGREVVVSPERNPITRRRTSSATASSWRPSREAILIRAASRSFRLSMRSRGITASCSGMENRRHDQIDSARARAQAPIPDRAYGCAAEPGPKAKAARITDRTKDAESSSASRTRRNRRSSAAVRRRMYYSGVCPRGGRTAMRPESGDSKATARPVAFTRRVLGSMGTRGSPKSEGVMVPVSSRE